MRLLTLALSGQQLTFVMCWLAVSIATLRCGISTVRQFSCSECCNKHAETAAPASTLVLIATKCKHGHCVLCAFVDEPVMCVDHVQPACSRCSKPTELLQRVYEFNIALATTITCWTAEGDFSVTKIAALLTVLALPQFFAFCLDSNFSVPLTFLKVFDGHAGHPTDCNQTMVLPLWRISSPAHH